MRLREERTRLGLNQTEFARAAGTTQRSQTAYENGDRSPDLQYLAAVAEIGVDVDYVVTGRRRAVEGVPAEAVQKAVETAYEMIKSSGVTVTGAQLAQMVKALLPVTPGATAQPVSPAPEPAAQPSMGHGNMVASGNGITQVGGRVTVSRQRKMKSN